MELLNRLAHHAQTRPQAEAIRQIGDTGVVECVMTYSDLAAAVHRVSGALAKRFAPGMGVVLQYPNCIDYAPMFLGCLSAGLSIFPVYPNLTESELSRAVSESGASAVLRAQDGPLTANGNQAPVRREGAALLMQSGGTTGRPKIARRQSAAIDAGARNAAFATRLTPADRVLGMVPGCHAYGIEHLLLGPIWAGARLHLCRTFDRDIALAQIEHAGITVFPGVPFMYEILGQGEKRPLPASLRLAFASGAPLPRPVFEAIRHRFGITLGQLYGTTELVTVTFNHPDDEGFDPMAVGRPMPGVEIRVIDVERPEIGRPLPTGMEGQVAVKSPSMFIGYLGDATAEVVDGFFLTGDLGRLDCHGALTITGRTKLLIDIGGLKVNPLEVEAALMEHPAVRECVVVPVPVSQTLVRLKAVLTLKPGASAPGDEELRAWARPRLSQYKIPRAFEIRPQMPKNGAGKIQRQVLTAGG